MSGHLARIITISLTQARPDWTIQEIRPAELRFIEDIPPCDVLICADDWGFVAGTLPKHLPVSKPVIAFLNYAPVYADRMKALRSGGIMLEQLPFDGFLPPDSFAAYVETHIATLQEELASPDRAERAAQAADTLIRAWGGSARYAA